MVVTKAMLVFLIWKSSNRRLLFLDKRKVSQKNIIGPRKYPISIISKPDNIDLR